MKRNIYLSKSIGEENKNIKPKDIVLDYGDLDDEVKTDEDTVLDYGNLDDEVKTDERSDGRSVGGFDCEDLDEE